MKKPTVIIGKKQILLSGLTLLLGGAVYLNYVLAYGNGLLDPSLGELQSTVEHGSGCSCRSGYRRSCRLRNGGNGQRVTVKSGLFCAGKA